MNIKLQTNEQLSATVANGLAGVFINGVSLSANLSGKADLTALQNYYTKSETSSSSEISNELKKYQLSGNYLSANALDDYYQKSETSSASELSTAFENSGGKVYFDNRVSGVTGSNDLSVVKLSADEYAQMLENGTCLSNAIYIVEAPNIDAFKQQIKNVAPPTDLSDAATKEYVDNALTGVQIPTDLSAFTNSPGYTTNTGTITGITMNGASKGTSGNVDLGTVLTAHQSLSNCLQNNSSYDGINLTANSQCTFDFPHINLPDTSIQIGDLNTDSLYASMHRVKLKEIDADGGYSSVEITTAPDIQIASVVGNEPKPPKTPAELMSGITFTGGTKNSPVTSSLADLVYTKSETSSAVEIETALNNVSVDLSEYYLKSETSSASEIYNGISSKLDSSAAAPEFDVLSTYSPWQYVTYEGKLWRFTTQHVSGDWNAAQAELVDMTTPDATLDLMNDGRLRVVLANGMIAWTQGYSMVSAASSLSTLLLCEAVNFYKYAQTTASAFSDLSTYAVGDRVIYQSSVYAFISAHAAGAWASAEVDLDPDSHMFMLPSVPAGKVGDFVLDIDNTANSNVGVIATLNNLSTAFDMYVPAGESLPDILSFEANEQCELYFTMTAFGTAAKPAWKVVKQVVEKQGAGT